MFCVVTQQYPVGDGAVGEQLYRAVVQFHLFRSDEIGVMVIKRAVHAGDGFHVGANRSQVVRHHDDAHPVVQIVQKGVKFLLEFGIHIGGRFVQNQDPGGGDDGPA